MKNEESKMESAEKSELEQKAAEYCSVDDVIDNTVALWHAWKLRHGNQT